MKTSHLNNNACFKSIHLNAQQPVYFAAGHVEKILLAFFTLLAPVNASKFRLRLPNVNKPYALNFHVVIVLSDQNYGT